jgi:hypothetical protein
VCPTSAAIQARARNKVFIILKETILQSFRTCINKIKGKKFGDLRNIRNIYEKFVENGKA